MRISQAALTILEPMSTSDSMETELSDLAPSNLVNPNHG
jgi:hypothetical protein